MKLKSIIVAMAAMLAMASCKNATTREAAFEYGPYTATRIVQDKGGEIWHLQDCNSDFPAGTSVDSLGNRRHNNCSDMYLLLGNEAEDGCSPAALLVDLGATVTWNDSAEQSLRHIVDELRGERPLMITFTHNHGDHTAMLPAFRGDSSILYELPENDFSDSAHLAMFAGENIHMLGDDVMLTLGGMDVLTIEVPGHTPGSMCFYVVDHNILLTGDAIGSGHGVWIFSTEGFRQLEKGIHRLTDFVLNSPSIDTTQLRIYGGHYHQKEWLEEGQNFPDGQARIGKDEALGIRYLMDMQKAVELTAEGKAEMTPLELKHPILDTYFTYGTASVVWNRESSYALTGKKP